MGSWSLVCYYAEALDLFYHSSRGILCPVLKIAGGTRLNEQQDCLPAEERCKGFLDSIGSLELIKGLCAF